jgi:hypothetical protein
MLQLSLARELGCTLAELLERVTLEEILLWNTFFRIEREEEAKLAKKRR